MIVVDTNVIAYLWLPGALTARAEALLRRDPEWAAPLLWRSELRNVLATMLRRGDVDLDLAAGIMARAEAHLRRREFTVPSSEVLRFAERSRCSAYDCEFVVLARELGVSLVTTDRRVLSSFPETAVPLAEAT